MTDESRQPLLDVSRVFTLSDGDNAFDQQFTVSGLLIDDGLQLCGYGEGSARFFITAIRPSTAPMMPRVGA